MARFFSLALLIGLLPSGLAGPACAQKHKTASDCMLKCNTKWGFPGMMMGTNPWGTVMHLAGEKAEDWDMYVAKACGEETTSSTADSFLSTSAAAQPTKIIHQGLGTHSVTSTSVSSTSTSSRFTTSVRSTTSSTTRSTSSTTSTKATTTSTSTKAKTTTTPTSTRTTVKATPTDEATTNSFTGSDDNGDDDNKSNSKSTSNSNSNTNSNTNSDSKSTSNTNTGGSSGGGSSGGGGNGSRASNSDRQAYLDSHNSIRAKHGAVPVTWSNAAAEKAQQWADLCKNQHSGGTLGPLGENLAAGTGSFSITEAVKAWTDEVTEYNPNNPQPSHFTQVVWKATTQIGCAVQTCDGIFAGFGAAQYYVCEYSEQGNVIGNFGANVQV